jgi:nucleoid-associated protein YgaU
MASLTKATFNIFKADLKTVNTSLPVQFNPASLAFDKGVQVAEIAIPGLNNPVRQFIRGKTETLSVELFFDTTEKGIGKKAVSVTTLTDPFFGLVKIDPKTHASPVCSFAWGAKFPGDSLPERYGSQRRTVFPCLVTSVKQEFKLFSPEGTPLRAKLTLALEEYISLQDQVNTINPQSSDHTRSHVLEQGQTLTQVAAEYLGSAREWRHLADANGLTDPRRIPAGLTLTIPPLRTP